ncbi:MAG: hypothetical protein OXC01_16415 [Immundisolibacterales bacterium]|nr:hypothetical protein [Immundisolibacterales bacterium]
MPIEAAGACRCARYSSGPLRSQRGAALIALVLALALGSGLVSIEWLEATARSHHKALRTEAALAAAREGLIGYAVSYPDQHGGRNGPGYLPCPDTSGNGSPNTPCRANSIGRLPWRRLGLHDPRDGSGERLWYALADRFRANGYKYRPMNGETDAELVVDGRSRIAAVVLAPGEPLAFQDRSRSRRDVGQYLEAGNEIPRDDTFVSRGASLPAALASHDRLNDRVVAISRDELMAAAARRALAAVRAGLERYRDAPWNTGAFPWLAPWDDPPDAAVPVPGVMSGRLPIVPAGGSIATSFRIAGSLPGGAVTASGTVDPADVRSLARAATVAHGECVWTEAIRIDCTGEGRHVPGPGREWVFRVDLHLAGDITISPPSPTDVRRRSISGTEWVEASHVEVVDVTRGVETGRGRLEFEPGPVDGALAVEGVAYALGVGEAVPGWLYENRWHHLLMFAIAPSFAAGGEKTCDTPGRCLEVVRVSFDGRRNTNSAVAIALYAGPELAHQRRESPGLFQWLEGENANPANYRYEIRSSNESFNDRISVIAPAPGVFNP